MRNMPNLSRALPVLFFMAAGALMSSCAPDFGMRVAPQSVATSNQTSDIVGGRTVDDGSKFSKQVAMLEVSQTTENADGSTLTHFARCSGTFIARDIVLTAAHCLKTLPFDNITIRFGVTDQITGFSTTADRYVINSKFDMKLALPDDDLAILRTKTPLPDTYFVTPLASAFPSLPSAAAAVGFGINYYTQNRGPGASDSAILRRSRLHIEKTATNNSKAFSAAVDDKNGVSHGDSGGPLFIMENGELKQLGVVSSIGSETVGLRANYVDVTGQSDWIQQAIATLRK